MYLTYDRHLSDVKMKINRLDLRVDYIQCTQSVPKMTNIYICVTKSTQSNDRYLNSWLFQSTPCIEFWCQRVKLEKLVFV